MRKPSTDAKESRANAMRLSSCPGIHLAMSSTGISKFTSSSLYCWSNFGVPRLLSLLPISSRPLLNTGSFRRVRERRTMSMVCASSGEKVTKIGTPYLMRYPWIWKRMIRRTSCVPGMLRLVCSIFFNNCFAAGVKPGTCLILVMSPRTPLFLPSTSR